MAAEPDVLALQKTLYASTNPTRRWLHQTRRAWVEQAIAAHEVPDGAALEIGPGSGVYLPALLQHFASVTAADIADAFLEAARQKASVEPRLTVARTDITACDWPPARFDLILCSEVLEHVGDTQSALRTMARLLKPEGVLVLTTPHRWSTLEVAAALALRPPAIWLVRRIYREPVFELGHISLRTRGQLERELRAAGLVPGARAAMGAYLPLIAEFAGESGRRLAERVEHVLRGGPLEQLLWTQAYVCRRAP